MTGWIGALRGASRALVVLFAVALLPGLAWLAASLVEHAFGIGFWWAFVASLGLLSFLGIFAVLGAASDMQDAHSAAVDRGEAEG